MAGNGFPGDFGDGGPATSAGITPQGVAVDSAGNLYIAEGFNARVRKVSSGIITTVAGNGTYGLFGRWWARHKCRDRPPRRRRRQRRQSVHCRSFQRSGPEGVRWDNHDRGRQRDWWLFGRWSTGHKREN